MTTTCPGVRNHPLRSLWPLFLVLALEGAALFFVGAAPWGQPPAALATPFSALIAALVLLTGLLPALLRPSPETALAGCLAAVLAALLITPVGFNDLPAYFTDVPAIQVLPSYLLLRLVNGAAIGPLMLHLAARFPLRARLSNRALAGIYLVSLALLLVVLLAQRSPIRLSAVAGLVFWSIGLMVAAGWLLLRASRPAGGGAGADADPRTAQQARLLFFALLLAGLPALLRPLGLLLRTELIPYNFFLAFQLLVPLGVAYAVLRHDLFGIDRALRRALAYTVLSVLLLVIYLAITVGLTALLAQAWPEFRGVAALLGLFLAALAFEPLRRRVQRLVDRLLYPDRLNFQQAIAACSTALAGVVSRQQVVDLLTVQLPPQLGAGWASLSLAPDPDLPGRQTSEPAWNARLVVSGRALGRYWLGPRLPGPDYDAEERAQLQALAGQAALALAYADTIEALNQLNRDLEARVAERTGQLLEQQRSLAAYEERQRLARDLHDSVTQSLFSIHLSARALRNQALRNPQAAADGLKDLETAARQAQAEMRLLLAQLRAPVADVSLSQSLPALPDKNDLGPGVAPALAPLDLAALLRQHCAGLRRGLEAQATRPADAHSAAWDEPAFLDVSLEAPAELWLPEEQAHAALYIVREGLHNVLKHSGRRQAVCQVTYQGQYLHICIADDGQGFDPLIFFPTTEPAPLAEPALPDNPGLAGFGLAGMHQRLAALGGGLEIVSAPWQGTTLKIRFPVQLMENPDNGR